MGNIANIFTQNYTSTNNCAMTIVIIVMGSHIICVCQKKNNIYPARLPGPYARPTTRSHARAPARPRARPPARSTVRLPARLPVRPQPARPPVQSVRPPARPSVRPSVYRLHSAVSKYTVCLYNTLTTCHKHNTNNYCRLHFSYNVK